MNEISLAEVKKHNNTSSVWIVIEDGVYDVTKFLNEHPGGAETLLEHAGKDGTRAFNDVGHSSDARDIMKKYKVGVLPLTERYKECNTLKWALLFLAGAIIAALIIKKYKMN